MELFYGCFLIFLLNLTMVFNSLSYKRHNGDYFYCNGSDEGDRQVTRAPAHHHALWLVTHPQPMTLRHHISCSEDLST